MCPAAAATQNFNCTLSIEQPGKNTSSQINQNPEISPPGPAASRVSVSFQNPLHPYVSQAFQQEVITVESERKKQQRKKKLFSNNWFPTL